MIPYGRQSISENDILSVEKVLRSDRLTQGPAVKNFEQSIVVSLMIFRAFFASSSVIPLAFL